MTSHMNEVRIDISFIVPCYNELPDSLDKTVSKMNAALGKIKRLQYEILIIDDGSKKYSYSSIESENVKIIVHRHNMGYGASIMTGIHSSKHEWIGIVDADGTYPADYFKDFIEHLNEYDMIVGKRSWKDIPFLRRVPKFILQRVASFIADYEIPDLNSGMRLFKKEIAFKYRKIFPKRFSFTTTLTMICLTNYYKVLFVDIPYYKRIGNSSIHPIKDTIRFFSLVFRLGLYFKPLRFFVPLSLATFLIAILRGLRDVFVSDHIGGLSLVFFLMAFQMFFFGLIAEIINKK